MFKTLLLKKPKIKMCKSNNNNNFHFKNNYEYPSQPETNYNCMRQTILHT